MLAWPASDCTSRSEPPTSAIVRAARVMNVLRPLCELAPSKPKAANQDRKRNWILLARTTAFLRAVVPALAGVARMPYRTFLPWNAAGGLIWGVGVALLGYSAGSSYQAVERTLGRVSYVLVALIVLAFVALRLRRRRRKHVG